MAGKSGRSINNVPENPMKHIIFSWEGILVILFILVNIFCASFSEFYNYEECSSSDAGLPCRGIHDVPDGVHPGIRRD